MKIPYVGTIPVSSDIVVAYNHHAFRTGRGFSHAQMSWSVPLNYGKFKIKPKVIYCYPLSREFGEEFEIGVKTTYSLFD